MDIQRQLNRIERKLDYLIRWEIKMDEELTALEAQVKSNTDAEQSAVQVLNGIKAAMDKAVAAAQAAGATPEQLARINALTASLGNSAAPLAAAVVAGTSAEA